MERQREEEHERTERGVSLKVNMDMVSAALQVWARGCPMAMTIPVSIVLYKGRPLLLSPSRLPTVQDNPLQYEDHEEAGRHDELWKWEADLCEKCRH